jgi:hypothetical protein
MEILESHKIHIPNHQPAIIIASINHIDFLTIFMAGFDRATRREPRSTVDPDATRKTSGQPVLGYILVSLQFSSDIDVLYLDTVHQNDRCIYVYIYIIYCIYIHIIPWDSGYTLRQKDRNPQHSGYHPFAPVAVAMTAGRE